MNVKFITIEEYQELKKSLEEIKTKLSQKEKNPKDIILTNDDLMKLTKSSRRTIFTWRTSGLLGYSQIGKIILYRMSDVQDFLDNHYNKAFGRKR
jgi:hypothetical protein